MTTLSIQKTAPATRVRIPDGHEGVSKQYQVKQKELQLQLASAAAAEDAVQARQLARQYLDEDNNPVKLGRVVDAWCLLRPEAANDEDIPYIDLSRFSSDLDYWVEDIEPVLRHSKRRFHSFKLRLPVDQLRDKVRELLAADVECILGKLRPDEIAAFLETEPKN